MTLKKNNNKMSNYEAFLQRKKHDQLRIKRHYTYYTVFVEPTA